MKTLLVIVLMSVATLGIAQPAALGDTLKLAFSEEPKLIGRLEARTSFITGQPVQVRGIQGGANFGDRVAVGIGYHWLQSRITSINPEDEQERLLFRYVAPFFEYSFLHKKRWLVSIPLRIGIGGSSVKSESGKIDRGGVFLYEPAMTIEYQFLKYFGIGVGAGYRFMLVNNKSIDQKFNSPVYLFKFKVQLGKIYADLTRTEE
jgi:hypothetical protein